jgi:hypothetical protein
MSDSIEVTRRSNRFNLRPLEPSPRKTRRLARPRRSPLLSSPRLCAIAVKIVSPCSPPPPGSQNCPGPNTASRPTTAPTFLSFSPCLRASVVNYSVQPHRSEPPMNADKSRSNTPHRSSPLAGRHRRNTCTVTDRRRPAFIGGQVSPRKRPPHPGPAVPSAFSGFDFFFSAPLRLCGEDCFSVFSATSVFSKLPVATTASRPTTAPVFLKLFSVSLW